jgi:LPXTG-motif cell wall-anchored protein
MAQAAQSVGARQHIALPNAATTGNHTLSFAGLGMLGSIAVRRKSQRA